MNTEERPRTSYFTNHYILTFPGIDIESELNAIKANNTLLRNIGQPVKITKNNKSSLLIVTGSREQSHKLEKIREIDDQPVVVEPHRTLNSTRGTVFSETLAQSSDEEILEHLSDQGVIRVERMKKWENNQLKNTNRFILTFSGTYLPSLIKVTEWQRELVEVYIPKPFQCKHCFRFGHLKKWCRRDQGEQTCSRCSEPGHISENCTSEPHCINCKGNHHPRDKNCPTYKFRCEVSATQAKQHITRREAEDHVRMTFKTEERSYSSAVKRNLDDRNLPSTSNPQPLQLHKTQAATPANKDSIHAAGTSRQDRPPPTITLEADDSEVNQNSRSTSNKPPSPKKYISPRKILNKYLEKLDNEPAKSTSSKIGSNTGKEMETSKTTATTASKPDGNVLVNYENSEDDLPNISIDENPTGKPAKRAAPDKSPDPKYGWKPAPQKQSTSSQLTANQEKKRKTNQASSVGRIPVIETQRSKTSTYSRYKKP